MNNLSVNIMFCEEFDEEKNSIINSFDSIILKEPLLKEIKMVVVANRTKNLMYHSEVFLCKLTSDRQHLEKVVDKFSFDIPKEFVKDDSFFINSEFFLIDLDISTIKFHGEGEYLAMVLVCPIDESDDDTDKEIAFDISKMKMVAAANLNVSLGVKQEEAIQKEIAL